MVILTAQPLFTFYRSAVVIYSLCSFSRTIPRIEVCLLRYSQIRSGEIGSGEHFVSMMVMTLPLQIFVVDHRSNIQCNGKQAAH